MNFVENSRFFGVSPRSCFITIIIESHKQVGTSLSPLSVSMFAILCVLVRERERERECLSLCTQFKKEVHKSGGN